MELGSANGQLPVLKSQQESTALSAKYTTVPAESESESESDSESLHTQDSNLKDQGKDI